MDRDLVFDAVKSGATTSAEIAVITGIPIGSVSAHLSALFFIGKVRRSCPVRMKDRGPVSFQYFLSARPLASRDEPEMAWHFKRLKWELQVATSAQRVKANPPAKWTSLIAAIVTFGCMRIAVRENPKRFKNCLASMLRVGRLGSRYRWSVRLIDGYIIVKRVGEWGRLTDAA